MAHMMVLLVLVGLVAAQDQEWEAFKAKYQKHYKDAADEHARHGLFKASHERVAHLNKLNGKAGNAFGINWMSDRYEMKNTRPATRNLKVGCPPPLSGSNNLFVVQRPSIGVSPRR
jgi:hypothetical protein